MSRVEEKYRPAISGKKLPIVTIDHKWHQLFARVEKTRAISDKEQETHLRTQALSSLVVILAMSAIHTL